MNHILVTGGAGFIGSNFVRHWQKANPNCKITVLDKLTYAGNRDNLPKLGTEISFIQGNITDPLIVSEAMQGVDTVVHFAAETHVDRSISQPDEFVKTNVLGTQVLLDQALRQGVQRFHHVSTDEVFGHLPLTTAEKWKENAPYNPRSPYAASKAGSDHLVRAYYTTFGLPVTISNCANNYGPFLYPEKLLALAITNILEGKPVPVYTPGNQIREWLYVTDHCEAIAQILEKGRIGETYFISHSAPDITNIDVIRKLLSIMGVGEEYIQFVPDRPGHDQRYGLDASKIYQELGWKARVGLDEGLARMVAWYKENQNWWKKIKSGSYQHYYQEQYQGKVV